MRTISIVLIFIVKFNKHNSMKNFTQILTSIFSIGFIAYLIIVATDVNNINQTKKYKIIPNDPLNTLIYTLDNGLKIYMSINKDEPRIQTNIVVNTGSKQDPKDATGLAHYLEHMLFKGTSKIGTINWDKEKEELNKISDLYEKQRVVLDENKRNVIYSQIDSISVIAAKYAVANEYDKVLNSSISVVTPNKLAASGPYDKYLQLKGLSLKRNVKYLQAFLA